MNALVVLTSSSSTITHHPFFPQLSKLTVENHYFVSSNGYSSFSSHKPLICISRLRRTSVIVAAHKTKTKKKNTNNKSIDDTHSFVPKPDEATGPFPEAVLLKQKKVQEDGRLLPEFADAEERELFEALNLQLESDLNVEQMRHYEVVYLIHENYVEEVESVNTKIQAFIRENKGKIWRINDWGLRRLAYKIQKAKNAHYILTNFELEAKLINDFKSMMDKDERIIRHLVIKREQAETKDCPPPPEIHTLRGGMGDDDEEDEIEYDDGKDWVDEGEIDVDGFDDDTGDGIIYVGDDPDDCAENKISKLNNKSQTGRTKIEAEKVRR